MTVTQHDTHFELKFDYRPAIVAEVKAIGQGEAKWNPIKKTWSLPLDKKEAIERLAKKTGATVVGSRPEEYGEIPELPELTVDIPLKRPLFPFQAKGTAYILDHKRVIIGDQPGLGKTSQAIAAAVATNRKCVLVICPNSLKLNWQKEFMEVGGMRSMILSDKVKNTWHTFYKVGYVNAFIVNYESLRKYFVESINRPKMDNGLLAPLKLNHIKFKPTIDLFDMVICDELHKCKDGETKQAKFVMGVTRGKEYVLGITGTPVVNKPKDLLSQLHIIQQLSAVVSHLPYPTDKRSGKPTDASGYQRFMDRYCGKNGSGAFNLKELNYRLSITCFYQRQKKEVLTELPDKMRQIVLCDITNRKEYQEAISNLGEYLKKWKNKSEMDVEKSLRGEIMVLIGVCKNISARGKMVEVFDHIDEVLESGQKFGVFVHQKEVAAAIKRQYPHALTITGDDSIEARNAAVIAFQNDPASNLIILSIKAANVGLTLTAASRMGFVEMPWHAADCDQCEDRFHRIGQKDSVQCTYFLGKDTIDEDIYDIIEKKRKVANEITGSTDDIQREIIDRLADSLFNKKANVE